MERIDAHIHFDSEHPAYAEQLAEWNMKFLNTIGGVEHPEWRARRAEPYARLAAAYPERFGWVTSFDLPRFGDREYAERCIAGLEADFARGAVGCKIWKSFGLGFRDPEGRHVLVDHPILEPILSFLERSGKTLLIHIADPIGGWQPLGPENLTANFYRKHPEKYAYGNPAFPAHETLIASRDRIVERHPKLRVVGAHLGSLEFDAAQLARRFERYPNFAVDTSGLARALALGLQDRGLVRRICIEFQDRLLFGSDQHAHAQDAESAEARAKAMASIREGHAAAFAYYESDGRVKLREHEVQGLGLPEPVLRKLYVENARRWYPGL